MDSTGDALDIGNQLGAQTGYLDAYQGHGAVADPHGVMATWAAVKLHGVIVDNERGERFGDETIGYSEYARRAGPARRTCLADHRRADRRRMPAVLTDYQRLVEMRAIRWADDAPARATDRTRVTDREDARRYPQPPSATGPTTSGRTFASELRAPYGAIRVTGALFHTQGGLLVSPRAGVLRAGVEIPGLFAAGGAAAGMSGHGAAGYLAGNGLLAAVGLGYLAGRQGSAPV